METEQGSFLRRLAKGLFNRHASETTGLNLGETSSLSRIATSAGVEADDDPTRVSKSVDRADTAINHDLVHFTDPKTNRVFFGHAVCFLPGQRHPSIEPGSHDLTGAPGVWVNDMEIGARTDWSDDPQAGIFSRPINGYRGVLGRAGVVKGIPYVFKDVLQVGQNVVIYRLEALTGTSVAIGLGRGVFDPLYGLIVYLRKTGTGQAQYSTSKVIALCDLVLEALPADETALFNKGVALMVDQEFRRSHWCFQRLTEVKPEDQLALLHDAVVLAKLEEDERALEQFILADSLSEEQCKGALGSITSLREPLYELVRKRMIADPGSIAASSLWSKYFVSAAP